MIRRKDRLRQMACRSSLNDPVHAEYKRIREEISKKLRRRRRDFVKEKMEAAGNDQKKLWKALAVITGYKELDREDTTEISAQSFADMLKAHMSSPHSPMESAHPALEATTGPSFEIKQVSVEAVKIALQNINTDKATGIDLIPPRALQHAASVVATPLSIIINTSIQLECFPRLWGRARVFPVYKNKGSKSDTTMYRLISILCAAALVYERLVGSQLRDFLEDNRRFDDRQHVWYKSAWTQLHASLPIGGPPGQHNRPIILLAIC